MPIIRTSEERFKSLPGFPFAPHYVEINGLKRALQLCRVSEEVLEAVVLLGNIQQIEADH